MVVSDLIERCIQSFANRTEIGRSSHRRAEGINGDFIELAERTFKGGQRLVHFLDVYVRHAQIENYSGGDGQRIAGKEIQGYFLAIIEHGEILGQ